MSENEKTESAMGDMVSKLLQDPEAQKALLDVTKPILDVQEAVFQQIIDQQNKILTAMQAVIDKVVEVDGKLAELLSEVKK